MTGGDRIITAVHARRVWDSRGRPTVEVELIASDGAVGRSIAPSGASTGAGERLERRDGGARLAGFDVAGVVSNANAVLPDALVGTHATPAAVDAILVGLDPDRATPTLGGNVLIATSLAAASVAAAASGRPLWAELAAASGDDPWLPLPEIQIVGGGAHAQRGLDLQDLMVVTPGATSFAEAVEWANEVYLATARRLAPRGAHGVADEGGLWPVFRSNTEALDELTGAIADAGFRAPDDVAISIDVAATQLWEGNGYSLTLDGRRLAPVEMVSQIVEWCRTYPIALVEDPLHEDDIAGHAAVRAEVSPATLVVGDDLLVTDPARVAAAAGAVDALLLKPNQVGTLTGARAALEQARRVGMRVIASARSGETEDVSIAHVAVGWRADLIKVGSVTRGERTAKWNEMIRIEEALVEFAGRRALRS